MPTEPEYDIALSFAGEDREHARALALALKQRNVIVFYDEFEEVKLWGENLYDYLSDLYQNRARYVVMFLSEHYALKLWTNHEREAAQSRAFQENKGYILPIRLDDTPVKGILPTVSYINWHAKTPEAVADMVLIKLGRAPLSSTSAPASAPAIPRPSIVPPVLPKRGDTKINPKEGATLLYIPAGNFLMGDDDQRDNPRRTITLDGYWIYKTPVTVGQYRKFCTEMNRQMPFAPDFNKDWKQEDHPVVNVNWVDAQAYCAWAGVQLPTEAQWEKAARGTEGLAFPWGDKWKGSKCANSVGKNDMNSTAAVGSYPSGSSPYGCLDMAGNVWEWCANWYGDIDSGSEIRNPTEPEEGQHRVLRGGSWTNDYPEYFRAARRDSSQLGGRNVHVGFRCVSRADSA